MQNANDTLDLLLKEDADLSTIVKKDSGLYAPLRDLIEKGLNPYETQYTSVQIKDLLNSAGYNINEKNIMTQQVTDWCRPLNEEVDPILQSEKPGRNYLIKGIDVLKMIAKSAELKGDIKDKDYHNLVFYNRIEPRGVQKNG